MKTAVLFTCFLVAGSHLTTPNVLAGEQIYRCSVDSVAGTQIDGDLRKQIMEWAQSAALIIDRQSGRAHHPYLGNTAYPTVRVISSGGAEWGFRSLAENPSGGATYYEVNEFAEGVKKPFVVVSEGRAFIGECE